MWNLLRYAIRSKKVLTSIAGATLALALGQGAATAQEPIKLGFVGGISGPCAPLVDSQLKGLKIALAQFNEVGGADGRKVELIVRDGKSAPDESAKAARALIVQDGVDMLTGPCSSAVLLSVSSVAKEEKIPIYSVIAGSTRASVEFGHRYLYLIGDNSESEPRAVAKYVAERPWTKIATIALDYEWGHQVVEEFIAHLKELKPEVEITRQLWPRLGETNFSSIIPPALAEEPDMVFAVTFGSATTDLIQQGRSYNMLDRTKLLTFMPLDSLKAMGDQMPDGIYGFQRAPFYALPGKNVETFVSDYQAAHNEHPDDWAVLGYDGFMQMFSAVRSAGNVENEKLRAILTSTTFEGLRGAMTVRDVDGTANSPTFIGVTGKSGDYPFPILKDIVAIKGE